MSYGREKKPLIFAVFIALSLISLICLALWSCDYDGPLLSERNPNGTIDYWYLFDGAAG